MTDQLTRRHFLKNSLLAGAGMLASPKLVSYAAIDTTTPIRPTTIASANGLKAASRVMELLLQGADTLDAVIAGVNIVEDDPDDMSVGLGGLPNEDGVVELDASVMHGPTGRGGAVAALRNIRNPSSVAKVVMERSDHVLLVGEGALRFARAHGFQEENLLTDRARERWLKWKENLSTEDDWLPPHGIKDKGIGQVLNKYERESGTINCLAVDANGNLSGCTSTSGLEFKIPGRVGDSPILGAGLYVDNDVGAAGSTGRGEANLLSCSSVMAVEYMRQGQSPEDACLMACRRIVDQTREARLLDDNGRPLFNVKFYALNRKGEYGSASIWSGGQFAVNTGQKESVLKESAYLFKRP
jgi:N4-(beta-N-acetylglucosaminyl)-L-asparaginase